MADRQPTFISLKDLVRFIIVTLTAWAGSKTYGEIRIVVQGGQIEFCHVSTSHRGSLPKAAGPEVEAALRQIQS
jgi:hypothetical protein